MRIIPHTQEMIDRAKVRANQMGEIRNSITRGAGNLAGFLGEEAIKEYLGAEIVESDEKFDYDIFLNGECIEVKTKRRTVAPRDYYDVSVASTSTHQRPDTYIFISLEFNELIKKDGAKAYRGLKNIWLLGKKDAKQYFEEATLWKKGDIDTSNKFTTLVDMWNLPISKLICKI